MRIALRAAVLVCLVWLIERPLLSLPTMIRLGYPNCASCHVSPQGGALLNLYGRGIDQAQSLTGGEYSPSENSLIRGLNWGGRINQDLRMVFQEQNTSTTSRPGTQLLRNRFIYHNATELGRGFRLTALVTAETDHAPRPPIAYDPPTQPATLFVNTALISYRPTKHIEFAAGRDQLPTGVNVPDLSFFIRSRNRLGYYDSPTQVKAFFWGDRYLT